MSTILITYISNVDLFLAKLKLQHFLNQLEICIVTNLDVGNRFSLTITKWTHTQMILLFYIS